MESGIADTIGRRVIVEVRNGPMASRKGIIEPGGALRVGRTEKADIAISHDEDMSGVHFELTWDGATCALADLGSEKGTFLSGERVPRGTITNGDWIRAGSTDFLVFFEMHTRPEPKQLSTLPVELREEALRELTGVMKEGSLYAVLDAARSERILYLLRESVEEYRSLFDGVSAETMADGAPYLVKLREGSPLLSRLVREGWGSAWGAYFTCKRSVKEIRAHFRKILMVTLEDQGEPVYFRFYDPRVLEMFLPLCTPRQEDEIFGEIERFLCEDAGGRLVRYVRSPRSVRR